MSAKTVLFIPEPSGDQISGGVIVTVLGLDQSETTLMSVAQRAWALTAYVLASDHECDALVDDDQLE